MSRARLACSASRHVLVAATCALSFSLACGGSGANSDLAATDAPDPMERCAELTSALPRAAATGSHDWVVVSWIALKEHYPECRSGVESAPASFDRAMRLATLDLLMLQATHMAADSYYALEDDDAACETVRWGQPIASDAATLLNDTHRDYSGREYQELLQGLAGMLEPEARFFAFAATLVCAPSPSAP